MIKAGIVGVSGYGGIELYHLLKQHPDVEIMAVSSRTYAGQKLSEVYPHLAEEKLVCKDYSPEEIAGMCDVVFTGVPHGGPAMDYANAAYQAGKKFIDLSADFRFNNQSLYEEWYKVEHKYPELLKEAVYGLPELHRDEIKKASLIGNPGCYTTAAILALAPVLKEDCIDRSNIIVDAKSGTSGAGRKVKQMLHFSETDENFQAYSVEAHRHTPEIEQELSLVSKEDIKITFVPHLVPMVRGILSVSYTNLTKKMDKKQVTECYKDFYQNEPFVRVLEDHLPATKFVSHSNFIDISVNYDQRNNRLIIISAIDNLIKGASGQAVQNMNLLFGLDETKGLRFKRVFP